MVLGSSFASSVRLNAKFTFYCYGSFDSQALVAYNEPRSEKTGLRGFRPGPTQTGL